SLGLEHRYEESLRFDGGWPSLPDFVIQRPGLPVVYWVHIGMLDKAGYRADWNAKCAWYAAHGILLWKNGGGPAGHLVWSVDDPTTGAIDARQLEELARKVFRLPV